MREFLLQDRVPDIIGFKDFYGKSVFHCPYCDGWEVRDKKIGVYAKNKNGWELALNLKAWSKDITLYTDGKNNVKAKQQEYLDANNIPVVKEPIERLYGEDGQLKKIVFRNGEEKDCDAIFFVNGFDQQCNLTDVFNCEMSPKGDVHFVVVAAAEGAKAGVTINKELQKEIYEAHLKHAKAVV
jgi:thioredoxin reductase